MARPKSERAPKKLKPVPPIAPVAAREAPLPAELLTAPRQFGRDLMEAQTVSWHYWPVPVLAGVLSGLAYALLMRPALNLAAQEMSKTSAQGAGMPTILTHVTNGFGSFFLTALTFLIMWGLGRLGSGPGRDSRGPRVAEVYSASFALLIPLYLLVTLLTFLPPAHGWHLTPAQVTGAGGDLLKLQHASTALAAQTPAALALIVTTLLGTAAQFGLAFPALRETLGNPGRALLATLLPVLPALLVQFINVAPLLLSRG